MTSQAKRNFFEGGQKFDWESYVKYRPNYDSSGFYQQLWDYHQTKGNGSWALAYDVGCGPAQVAECLASKFSTVVASDVSPFHVNVARDRLGGISEKGFGKVECLIAPGETVDRPGDEGQVDMLAAAECVPLMDTKAAISNFARLMKPGGTLAIWFYGGPIYTHNGQVDALAAEIRRRHREITSLGFEEHRPFKGTIWAQAWNVICSWLDSIDLPESEWKNVQRIKHNHGHEIGFIDQDQFDAEVQYASKVKPGEEVFHEESSLWKNSADFSWAKGFIDTNIPRTKDYITDEVRQLYESLEEKMSGEDFEVIWPAVCIFATRK